MELEAIAACVIGGTALKGGHGTAGGVLFGALIMVALLNGMTLLAVSPEIKFIARGAVLTLADASPDSPNIWRPRIVIQA